MERKQAKDGAGETREARLKAALKANIARRKQQARAREAEPDEGREQEED
ncbi:hypothetical protein OG2516_17366 [Oceanicola granulosus HTCC2516]|uniref:Uncharacterized protein n=1 Tax=Oceanicola granulosus (strain ATCC BAA-861 / DSM 15982 / KCTC 12143 / HTCC2516) TaxID=314256 RepID=Q2CFH0_OCEGH|nr:hypothetical protein [Oceanicola granulosus]EAR51512.1 hypothetical protein OG2516_17366 [Oceanicola granulosus HTCC2516]